jgi:hypothetical protein
MTQPSLGCADVRLRADRDISTSHDRSILVGMWSKNGDRADRSVLARWLEAIAAVVIVLIGVLGWKLIIVDVWLAETDEHSIGVAHALAAKTH